MAMEGLGRLFNVLQPMDDVYVSLKDAGGVSFSVFEVDGATVSTITFSSDAAGTATSTPDVVDHYYGRSADQGGGVWHRTAVSPASESVTDADVTEDQIVIYIDASMCPDDKPYVKCTVDGSGVVTAILHDLHSARAPQNLPSATA